MGAYQPCLELERPAGPRIRTREHAGRHPASGVNADFVDLLRALLGADARFLVVGAHALAVHGVPRATQDLDVFIDPAPDNAVRVWKALTAFGAPIAALGVTVKDLEVPGNVIQIGMPPRRIDLLTQISGVTFDDAWQERVAHDVEGNAVPFLGRASLVANKRAAGRHKDLGDIEALGEVP